MKIDELQEQLRGIYNSLPPKQRWEASEKTGHHRYWILQAVSDGRKSKIDTLARAADAMGYKVELSIGDEWTDCDGVRRKITEKVLACGTSMIKISLKMGYRGATVNQMLRNNVTANKGKVKYEFMEDLAGVLGYRLDIRLTKKEDA